MTEVIRNFFHRKSTFSPSPFGMLLSYLALGFWAIVVLFPLYWLVVTSLKLPIDVNTGPFYVPFVDFQPSLHAWDYILVGDLSNDTIRPYINTVVVALTSASLALLLGTTAAYGLTRFQYRPRIGAILMFIGCLVLVIVAMNLGAPWQIAVVAGIALFILLLQTIGKRFKRSLGNNDIAFWLISQRMLPPVAVVIPIYVLFQRLHLLDTWTALVVTYLAINLPIVVWLMRDYFQTIPLELEECAAIDGASRYRVFWSIVLPLSVPGLVATFLFVLVFAWNEYLLALFLSGADSQTMPLSVAAQNATRGPQWWYMSVLILIMIVPVIAMAIALERYIARGLLVGAIKG
ncbi:MAG: carbohydrate ABC transporter permease [Anaerolineae bacterium]